MNRSLREVLASSHVAAVAILTLLFSSIYCAFQTVWPYVVDAIEFIVTAMAILDIPFVSFNSLSRLNLIAACAYLYAACADVIAAWLLSLWIYRSGPINALIEHRKIMTRKFNAEI